ncbi:MAG: nitrate reductase subunit alpha [Bryobacterales bacterium]|nr:nitrate reductase subunit alpha [Bryobacterales bacterium]
MSNSTELTWIRDQFDPKLLEWEEFYRNRWEHDKVVRSTHGVNCTGGCTWNIYVKNGIVTWEMQGLDYPLLQSGIPPYEPRGCQRGISFSWYLYSPLRVKYPYARGALLDLWTKARAVHADPVDAWKSLVENPETRRSWQQARGKGDFRRIGWEQAVEMIAAANIYTISKYGPDRIAGFSPIPAMSMVSYASGARLLQLMGGVSMSFYDWYCDLPPASPETWGEQTDVHESADWYNAKLLAICGSNVAMTRTPDSHFATEARHNGTRQWVFSPDFSQQSKFADNWIPINAGQDGAWWMAVNHVLLQEFHHNRQVPYFLDYCKRYTDSPFLVTLEKAEGEVYRPGPMLRANRLATYRDIENGDWKFLMWDETEQRPKMPLGSTGFRWQTAQGKWNLKLEDGLDGSPIAPALTFLGNSAATLRVAFDDFSSGSTLTRSVPVKLVQTGDGREVAVTTVYDLLMAQYGVSRELEGDYPRSYDDDVPYTPAWSEKYTGISRNVLIRFAREWGNTAEGTGGKCMVIIGAGVNHWYHNNLMYRAAIHALMFAGCPGVNGGGLAHYVGQEKLAPMEPWSAIAFAKDWHVPSRLQNSPSWHYVHSDQWRYESEFSEYHTTRAGDGKAGGESMAQGHTMDLQVRAVKNGWLPFYPQFNRSPLEVMKQARAAGAKTEQDIGNYLVEQLRQGELKFAVEDPDAEENWPRVWFIWRGNAILASAKGHEYFLNHYLGTHHSDVAGERAKDSARDVVWRENAPQGKMDLIVDLNFRMDTSALYSDIVLPAATWYEKDDLNSTDLHSFIHPLQAAVPPCWESKSDWKIFQHIARKFSELAEKHLPDPVEDVVALPLAHDTPAEMAQAAPSDWAHGAGEAVPGKTMPAFKVVERDYRNLYNRFNSLGRNVRENGLGAHGTHYHCADFYDEAAASPLVERWGGQVYPSLAEEKDVCNLILTLASVTNGELAWRSYKGMEARTGLELAHLAERNRGHRVCFADIVAKPVRLINSPMWSGLTENGRPYSPFTYNVEQGIPWRTLTGRQHFYLDHPGYIDFGEHLPVYKPRPPLQQYGDLLVSKPDSRTLMLNHLTPHGKWHIHSTFGDNQRMTTLSRGCEPLWMNDRDAAEIGVADNDWVEAHNDHGVVVTRAAVSARIPRGICLHYHSPERTYSVPKSPLRGNRRAGGHNSLTRIRLKPNLMMGGYGQFTYHFNYWGPTGTNRDTHIYVRRLDQVEW